MTHTAPFTLRWGILSTGSIATEFAQVSPPPFPLFQLY